MKKNFVPGFLMAVFGFLIVSAFKYQPSEKREEAYTFQQQKKPGEIVYKKYCISCHQADGGGVPNMSPSLIQGSFVLGEKQPLVKIVLNGLKNVTINDKTYNNPMPALGTILKDKQIADVLTYVRNSFGNKASAVTTAEVTEARK